MFSLRWEVTPLETPFSAPRGDVLWPPIASGLIVRENIDPATKAPFALTDANFPAIYGPSEPIQIPSTTEGWSSLLLVLENLGAVDWLVTFAPRGQTPTPADPIPDPHDTVPSVLVPASVDPNSWSAGRSREIRSVRPEMSFVARPRLYRKPEVQQ